MAVMFPKWKTRSLRARVGILLGGLFAAALTVGMLLLWIFSSEQILEENEPAARTATAVASALNAALAVSSDPEATLKAFAAELAAQPPDALRFQAAGETSPAPAKPPGRVPEWFIHSLVIPDLARHIPITIAGRRAGELVFEPDLSAQVYEKWMGFLALLAASVAMAILAGAISFVTIGAALRPLRDLADGLARLRAGDFTSRVDCEGPPEIHQSCVSVNELAATLGNLSAENRSLLRRMVSIQDEERRDMSRELHDELGPLLFAIRANVTAMIDDGQDERCPPDMPQQRVLEAVEALQLANRRILDRLRPLLIEELGLDASIQKLQRDVRAQVPTMDVAFEIDPDIVAVDSVVAQTVYRVLQEGITNVLKHAGASRLKVATRLSRDAIVVEVADNGANGPAEPHFGRGLTGMRERLRALDGTFDYLRSDGWTVIRCRLPVAAA